MPSPHAIGAILIAAAAFYMFARGTLRIELLSLLLIAVLALALYFFPIPSEDAPSYFALAFGGFGHEALIAICSLMILGRGLVVTGALEPAARLLTGLWRRSRLLGLLLTLIVAALMSMFVNDTPVLVLTLPLLLNLAARVGATASKTLMPVNCAILIGGMATTIGTSTNLLVVSIASDMGLPRFGVFDFADIALLGALVALPYLWLVMPRLLPEHAQEEAHASRQFQASLFITDASTSLLEAGPDALGKIRERLRVIGIAGREPSAGRALYPGDAVRVEGSIDDLREVSEAFKAPLAHPAVFATLQARANPNEDQIVAELSIGADSGLIGRSVRSAQIADRYGVAVLGFHRPNRFLHQELYTNEGLQLGDVLLVRGPETALRRLQINEGAMLLEGAAEMPRTALAPLALLIFVSVVALAALHIVPIAISALAGAIAMFATGCVKFERAGRALSGDVIVLVAASIALGSVLLETGAAAWIGGGLAFMMQGFPPAIIVMAMMTFAAFLTNFSSNTAAAGVGTPIAISLAAQVQAPAEPLVLAVLFGCNLCFATPIAYQTNILIMSAGGYQFRDYVRAGLPLVVLMIVTLSLLLVWKYQI